jgi:formylglycine-generating enzyme required for sulfatase activity
MSPEHFPTTRSDPQAGAGEPDVSVAGLGILRSGAELVAGYRLLSRLGRGGFGEVWKASGPGGVPVALKFVWGAEVEARALEFMKFVNYPHLLTTFGIWHVNGLLVIGMELADRTLLERLQEALGQGQTGIPFDELTEYMHEAAKGIDFLNEPRHTVDGKPGCSIVHRDIKPQNLLLVGGGVKVADFGLARALERSLTTRSGGLTPAYASPEQFQGHVSTQTDQYCLGISYCQLRTGFLPFQGEPLHVLAGHLTRPPDLTVLPEAEREIVARALAKQPHDRWPSCREFVRELSESGSKRRARVTPPDRPVVVNTIGMRLVHVPAGRFLMGSAEAESERRSDEGPPHFVTIARPFYVGAHSVTQREFETVMGHNPSQFKGGAAGPNRPVENVSWYDAFEFCRRLSTRYEEREAGWAYYLPTEAEWEYACRAGTTTAFAFGDSLSSQEANFNGNFPYGSAVQGPFHEETTPVGSFRPNAWGLYDMHGNVWEWCADFYGANFYERSPECDPLGPRSGDQKVLRGGNWNSKGGKNCRSARRGKDLPTQSTAYDGFRVVMIPENLEAQ